MRLRHRIHDARLIHEAVRASNGEAAAAGDSSVWHDNFAHEENQRQMHQLARRLRTLEEIAASAADVLPCRRAPPQVEIGSAVRIHRFGSGQERSWYIAGWEDGDPDVGQLAYSAPLPSALVGAKAGDLRVSREGGMAVEAEAARPPPSAGDRPVAAGASPRGGPRGHHQRHARWSQEQRLISGRFWDGHVGPHNWRAYKDVKVGFYLVVVP